MTPAYYRLRLDLPDTVIPRAQRIAFTADDIPNMVDLPMGLLSRVMEGLLVEWNRKWWGVYRFWV